MMVPQCLPELHHWLSLLAQVVEAIRFVLSILL